LTAGVTAVSSAGTAHQKSPERVALVSPHVSREVSVPDPVSAPQGAAFPHHGQAEPAPGDLLSRAEVARRLRVSEHTVARLAEAGDLEEIRVAPRSPRITPDSVERHLARNGRQAAVSAA
jgi:excisionase family DNA binding protein